MSRRSAPSLLVVRLAGLALLLAASFVLWSRQSGLTFGVVAPLLLGPGFLAWALVGRQPHLLVPAGVLTGLGAGLLAERWAGGGAGRALFFFGAAAGWAAIPLLASAAFRRRLLWPLVPAGLLAGIGCFYLGGASLPQVGHLVRAAWPLAALAIGAWLLLAKKPL